MVVLTNSKSASLTLPLTMSVQKMNFNKEVPITRITGDGGILSGDQTFSIREIVVSGAIFLGSKEANREYYDNLLKFMKYQPIEINRGNSRNILGYLKSVGFNGMDGDEELEVSFAFTAPDPFFYGDLVTEEQEGLSGGESFTIDNEGAYRSYPIISITINSGVAVDLNLSSDAGYEVEVTGTFVIDDVIIIDCKKMTATLNGDSIIGSLGDDFLVNGFALEPEDNELTFSVASGTFEADVVVEYRERWI